MGHFPLTKCLCPQYVLTVPGMSPGPHLTTPQNLKGENSFVGAPTSLYNLTKSAPDPLFEGMIVVYVLHNIQK